MMRKFTLLATLLCIPFLVLAEHSVTPGTFTIALGSYSDWNARIADSQCGFYGLDCELDNDEHRVVGDNTTTANSASQLQAIYYQFGFECLDKAARFADIGDQLYPDVGQYGGPLHNFFQGEANRCWNHYDKIYRDNKDLF